MDYSFHSRILLADAYRKHILIILVTDSQNFRKLQEFEGDENRTQKKKSIRLLIKRLNFSRMSILKPQNFISWVRGITNATMLWNETKAKNRSNLTPIKTHVTVFAHMAKLCSYILYKNISFKIVSKLLPGRFYKMSQWSSIKYLKSHI